MPPTKQRTLKMKEIIFLLSKDAMCCEYLPVYSNSNKYGKTPNLDELAKKGTVFNKHYTSGGSTAMAFSSILTGKNPFEFENRRSYKEVKQNEKESIFSILQNQGYECHMIWDCEFEHVAYPYIKEFGDEEKTKFHYLNIIQLLGYKSYEGELKRDDNILKETIKIITNELDSIDTTKKQFIWLHLPHVLKGRISYGDDIEAFDDILGYIRKKFGDENIYITADHGNMNMHKGKVGYGFDVYEPIAKVPLITPRIDNIDYYESLTSHTDLIDIILNNHIPEHEYVFCDNAYYAQPQRKLAVIGKRYKYIYNREGNFEELFDLQWDEAEEYNILKDKYFEKRRLSYITYSELYLYPYRDKALKAADELRQIKDSVWREPKKLEGLFVKTRQNMGLIKRYIISKIRGKN